MKKTIDNYHNDEKKTVPSNTQISHLIESLNAMSSHALFDDEDIDNVFEDQLEKIAYLKIKEQL